MTPVAVVVVLLNFAAVGLLPILFFRRDGRLNARWWLTAAPFFAAPALLAAAAAGLLQPATAAPWGGMLAVPFAVGSIALIASAIRAHRLRIALWHQGGDADAPTQLVTWGPYSRVRHPFYSAFLLALTGAVVLCPHPALAGLWVYGFVALSLTAVREERRLSASAFGAAYRAYVKTTGRFIPRVLR